MEQLCEIPLTVPPVYQRIEESTLDARLKSTRVNHHKSACRRKQKVQKVNANSCGCVRKRELVSIAK